jgi:hypothetical protein
LLEDLLKHPFYSTTPITAEHDKLYIVELPANNPVKVRVPSKFEVESSLVSSIPSADGAIEKILENLPI